ncbi:chloroplastic group IIA intron splicing facilitator CRS1, chloroplastic-like protein [Corchorus olitorius]|uniref:Chloroplastic group IIA intron splicing facilitator CRS1, chloroplastic-like protein n=1 Tax=Corchorus olitorius TaxID=93759 RepID=A0A1R3JXI8_9ROSI|nr:chloroplastic group IIA intron splicing facilitator CRS1, chloroplastic-like protein [Corchorus olitorius]
MEVYHHGHGDAGQSRDNEKPKQGQSSFIKLPYFNSTLQANKSLLTEQLQANFSNTQ